MIVRDQTRVADLVVDRSVRGVRLKDGETLPADLTVDASGRSSRCLEWLRRAGVPSPTEEVVDAFAGYASRFYQLAPSSERWWRGMVIDAKLPAVRRWGLLMPIEHGYHVLTLAGLDRD